MVQRHRFSGAAGLAAVALCMVLAPQAQAVNFGDMMSPGKWFGGGNNRDDGPYVPPPGYGAGAPYGYGAPPYGAPAGGSGAAPYGMPPGGGYGQQVPPPADGQQVPPSAYGQQVPPPVYGQPPAAAPAQADDSEARIKALEQRIQELEAAQRAPRQQMPAAPMPYQHMAPQSGMSGMSGMQGPGGFRPMNQ